MLPGVVPGGIGYDLTVFPVSCQKQAHLLIQEYFRRHIGLFLRLPKGMAFRQGQGEKNLHAPVGRAGGVISLSHAKIGISVAYRQGPAPVKDGHAQPPAQIAKQNALRFAPIHALAGDAGKGHGGKERALGKAIGEAAAVGQAPAFPVKPAGKARCDGLRPLDKAMAALGIGVPHSGGVDQAVIMEAPKRVVIPLGGIIEVPAVAHIVALHHIQVFPEPVFIHRAPHLEKTNVHQDAEKAPVVFRHVELVDLVEPAAQVVPLHRRQFPIKPIRHKAQARADDRHFHHPLVVIPDGSPVFRMIGIGAVDDAFPPQGPEFLRLFALSRQHGHQRPQHPGKALHARHVLGIVGRALSHDQTGLARRQAVRQGPDHLRRRPGHIPAGTQRVIPRLVHANRSFIHSIRSR